MSSLSGGPGKLMHRTASIFPVTVRFDSFFQLDLKNY